MDKKLIAIIVLVVVILIAIVGFCMISFSYAEIHEGDITDDGVYTFKITDILDNGLSGININIVEYYNGKILKNITAISDANGLITGKLSNQNEGEHTIVANYYDKGELDSSLNVTNIITYESV